MRIDAAVGIGIQLLNAICTRHSDLPRFLNDSGLLSAGAEIFHVEFPEGCFHA